MSSLQEEPAASVTLPAACMELVDVERDDELGVEMELLGSR